MPTLEERRARHAAYMREWRKTHSEKRTAEGLRKRYAWMTERRRQRKLEDAAYAERLREQQRRFRREHPEVHRAQEAVRRAVRCGQLTRPTACEQCSAAGVVEAAHIDYSRRLDVRWLCVRCHRRWDTDNPKCQP